MVDSGANLPVSLQFACHGSDNGRLAAAAGVRGNDAYNTKVFVLESLAETWSEAAVHVDAVREDAAGLLLGDMLVCMGGAVQEVSAVSWCPVLLLIAA